MKNISIILLFLIPLSTTAQILGQEVNCQEINGVDSFTLSVYRCHDASIAPIEDSASLYINVILNYPYYRKVLKKISQTLLYDSVYYVIYEENHIVDPFHPILQAAGYLLMDEQINTSDIVNHTGTSVTLNVGGRWYILPSIYAMPKFNYPQFSFYSSNNYIKHDASCTDTLSNTFNYVLVQQDSLHFYPSEITIDGQTGILSIDTTLSGKYLISIGVDNIGKWIIRTIVVDMDKLKIQLATNTKSVQPPKFTLNLHPNPTSETLQITTAFPVDEVQIYNSIGQQVWQGQGFRENQVQINVRDFSQGVYVVRVRQGESWVSKQVLVSRR
ncbi:MAG: T9SS type A sorting domain-containing protein [Saprospiraceae bacterium]|nr:T9SS type A sorting domain-containing protein [Saprospiraceae bacterium]